MKASDDAKECAKNIMETLEDQSCVGCKYERKCEASGEAGRFCKRGRKKIAKIVQEAIDKAYQDGYDDACVADDL